MMLVQLAARVVFMAAAAAAAEELFLVVQVIIAQVLTAQVAQSVSFTPAASVYSPQQTQGTYKWQLFQASFLR
jgi:predicted RNA-binding protein with PUA-like domain